MYCAIIPCNHENIKENQRNVKDEGWAIFNRDRTMEAKMGKLTPIPGFILEYITKQKIGRIWEGRFEV